MLEDRVFQAEQKSSRHRLTLLAHVQAPTARVTHACTALANISNRATERLANAVGSQPELASELVAVCVALPDAVSNGGAWSVECSVDAVRGVCRLLAAAPSALSGAAAPAQALAQCWSEALGSALSMASGAVRPSLLYHLVFTWLGLHLVFVPWSFRTSSA